MRAETPKSWTKSLFSFSLVNSGSVALAAMISPTPDGERFLRRCDAILAEVDSLSGEYQELSRKHKTISVGIPPMIGSILFPEIFRSFRKRHPEIMIEPVEIGSQAAKDLVADGELDLAVVTMGDELSSRLEAHRLTSYEMYYTVGPKHPLAREKTVTLAQTAQYPMILFAGGYYQRHLLDRRFQSLGIDPNILFQSTQLTTIKSFIRQDIASGFLMPQVVQKEDGITLIPVEEGLKLNVAVVWRKDDYLTKEAERFVSFCRRTFEAR